MHGCHLRRRDCSGRRACRASPCAGMRASSRVMRGARATGWAPGGLRSDMATCQEHGIGRPVGTGRNTHHSRRCHPIHSPRAPSSDSAGSTRISPPLRIPRNNAGKRRAANSRRPSHARAALGPDVTRPSGTAQPPVARPPVARPPGVTRAYVAGTRPRATARPANNEPGQPDFYRAARWPGGDLCEAGPR